MDMDRLLNDIKPHPRILFNDLEVDQIKRRVADHGFSHSIPFHEIWAEVECAAEIYAAEKDFHVPYSSCDVELNIELPLTQLQPVGDPPGYVDYPFWTMYSRAIEERIKVLAFSYKVTGKECFSLKVKEYLIALATFTRWYEFPHRGADGNLSIAHFILGVSIGYDAIYDTLSSKEKRTIEYAIYDKGLCLLKNDFFNNDSHNIIASKKVAMFIGSLAIMDPQNAKQIYPYYQNAYAYLMEYLQNRLADPEIEGLLYLNVAARHILMAADVLKRSTGNDELLRHEYFRFLPDLFVYMLGTGTEATFVNFSDSFYKLDIFYFMSVLASNVKNPICSWYLHHFFEKKLDVLLDFKVIPEPVPPDSYYKGNPSRVFPHIGWCVFRNGWNEDDHLLAFNASESAKDHNHFDQNNFILHVAGEWLITNPGYQDYVEGPRRDFTLGTIGHNSLLVNGKGQVARGKSRFVDWHTSENFSFVVGDASDAYHSSVSKWERAVVHVDQRYFVLIDKVIKKDKNSNLSFLFHTSAEIQVGREVIKPGYKVSDNKIRFMGNHSAADLTICYPDDVDIEVSQFPGAEQYGVCLEVKPKAKDEIQYMAALLRPIPLVESERDDFYCTFRDSDPYFEWKMVDESIGILDYLFIMKTNVCDATHRSFDGKVRIKGERGWVSIKDESNELNKFTLVNGSELMVGDEIIIQSPENINVSASFHKQIAKLKIKKGAREFFLLISPPAKIMINGVRAEDDKAVYHHGQGRLDLMLPKGVYDIVLIFPSTLEK
ncbi:heparinase II/III-family protein [Rossellomorea sp. KS-H15a]|uniref:heparinase II/III family protein n=1 Tax=Rossellomorea sp. KS-H15a TaxID=2963940 RepID=UPI0020C5CF25|nr:heparinase II/III-family protein [Rossellomorea sp. KS-H15a]UTE77426.1 heparinase II/III-family protein [Rossellomorea sp. KS-H15a]